MAQPSGRSPRNSNWDNPFLPSLFNGGSFNTSGASALSNNNGHGQFTSANSNPFQGHENHNISSGSHQDPMLQAPFSNHSINGTNSKVEHQGQELLRLLLQEAAPTKREIQDNIKNEVKPEVKKEIKEEISEEMTSIKGRVAHLEGVVGQMEKLWTQLLLHQRQNPLLLNNTKMPQ